jgi:hypothetical protein
MGIGIRMGLTGRPVGGGGGADPLTAALAWVDAGADGALIGPTSARWQDSARTTPWAADGDPVGAVADLSRFGSSLEQATPGNRPTGHVGYLLNNGTTSFLEGPSKTPKNGWYFAAACMAPALGGAAAARNVFAIGGSTATNRIGILIRSDAARNALTAARISGGTSFSASITDAFALGTAFRIEGWSDGTDLFLSINGGTPVSAPAAIGSGTAQPLFLMDATLVPLRLYAALARDGLPTGTDRTNIILPYLASVLP